MAGMAPKVMRSLRIDEDVWNAAADRAEQEDRTVSDVVRAALRAYAEGRYDARGTKVKVTR